MKAPEPKSCSRQSCDSKAIFETNTEIVTLPARKSVVTTWSCSLGHTQQTEKQLPTDEMEALMEAIQDGWHPYII